MKDSIEIIKINQFSLYGMYDITTNYNNERKVFCLYTEPNGDYEFYNEDTHDSLAVIIEYCMNTNSIHAYTEAENECTILPANQFLDAMSSINVKIQIPIK